MNNEMTDVVPDKVTDRIDEPVFNIAHVKLCTEVEGPFRRCCIWFQGCILSCPGCINPDLQELRPRHILPLSQVSEIVAGAAEKFTIEGVTLSGGEPLLQQGLWQLCREIRAMGLGIILFTGFPPEKIPREIRAHADLALAGPYIAERHDDTRFLIGSENKEIVEYTSRYHEELSYFDIRNHDIMEEVCLGDDEIFFNGN